MPTNSASRQTNCVVRDDDNATLDVVIGQGQTGGTTLVLAGKVLDNATGFHKFPLGKGKDLRGKTLGIYSAVTDHNPAHNLLVVTHDVGGVPQPLHEVMRLTVGNEESGRFLLEIQFI